MSAAAKADRACGCGHFPTDPPRCRSTAHWVLSRIEDHGPGHFYRYTVVGRNLFVHEGEYGWQFVWSIPAASLDNPQYDRRAAVVVAVEKK